MSDIKSSTLELVGKTPIVNASRYAAKAGVTDATILVKLEAFNPAGSVKDRIALAMIEDAEKKGILKEGATIIEQPAVTQVSVLQQLQRSKDTEQS